MELEQVRESALYDPAAPTANDAELVESEIAFQAHLSTAHTIKASMLREATAPCVTAARAALHDPQRFCVVFVFSEQSS